LSRGNPRELQETPGPPTLEEGHGLERQDGVKERVAGLKDQPRLLGDFRHLHEPGLEGDQLRIELAGQGLFKSHRFGGRGVSRADRPQDSVLQIGHAFDDDREANDFDPIARFHRLALGSLHLKPARIIAQEEGLRASNHRHHTAHPDAMPRSGHRPEAEETFNRPDRQCKRVGRRGLFHNNLSRTGHEEPEANCLAPLIGDDAAYTVQANLGVDQVVRGEAVGITGDHGIATPAARRKIQNDVRTLFAYGPHDAIQSDPLRIFLAGQYHLVRYGPRDGKFTLHLTHDSGVDYGRHVIARRRESSHLDDLTRLQLKILLVWPYKNPIRQVADEEHVPGRIIERHDSTQAHGIPAFGFLRREMADVGDRLQHGKRLAPSFEGHDQWLFTLKRRRHHWAMAWSR
jgi:hypothetical protein